MTDKTPPNLEELAGQKDATVADRTGRTWSQWLEALDGIGAQEMEHADIAKWVDQEIDDGWWAQTVAVGYERIRGLREVGQARSGTYEASKSKTIKASAEQVYDTILELAEDPAWAGDLAMDGATPHKSVRFAGADGSRASIWLTPVDDKKCRLSVSHTKLQSSDDVADRKTWWGERLNALSASATK